MVKFRLELPCFKYSDEHEGITIAKETMELLSLEFCDNKPDRLQVIWCGTGWYTRWPFEVLSNPVVKITLIINFS